ncbi:Sugar kinase of the NBD/HSP70 family, may contain an N-terminal HTH domain [Arthrobacter alpinus]|uniref:Sugar kinase of the NBD/HSP70 family, may contain an N-terminal HTH domain n=1 Tax=Arthrobacter alpinus TaxID=656366 RepID=A0A1H5NK29_9MICC|nr:ROK family transcriptional regulator [Arthrobacter alpinus]SEF01953.1 Sugar kinase of the NBD/HSP70 family, may contain an N-terminal HTH domain [Arthrobacter alpinus]
MKSISSPPAVSPRPALHAEKHRGPAALADSALELARLVLVHGPVSRGELAKELKLSVASLTRLSKPLLDAGLLVEGELVADGTVGRPVRLLDVRSDSAWFVGVKVGGDLLTAVLTDLRATILAQATLPLADTSTHTVVEGIAQLTEQLGAHNDVVVTGVGVSLGGQVRPNGVVHRAPFLDWNDVPLGALLATRLELPVVVDNDVTALVAAEQWFGAGREVADFAVITVGAGVGYGLAIRNHVIRTADTGLGLGGHFPLDPTGPMCMDGHRGCSTAMLSIPSICLQISVALGRQVNYEQALELAEEGNRVAVAVLEAAAKALGVLIAAAANLAMVNTIVLGGEGLALFTSRKATVVAALAAGRDPEAEAVTLRVASDDFTEWARGAAAVAIQAQAFIL